VQGNRYGIYLKNDEILRPTDGTVAAPTEYSSTKSHPMIRQIFSERCIGIGVGASCYRNHRGKLRVAQGTERTSHGGNNKGKCNSRPGIVGRRQFL